VRKRHLQRLPRGSGLSKNRYFFRHGSGGTMAVVRKSQPGEQQRNQEDGRNSLPLAYSLPKDCFWPEIAFMPGGRNNFPSLHDIVQYPLFGARSGYRFLIPHAQQDRKSTRLNSSHVKISYAVFCLKKK